MRTISYSCDMRERVIDAVEAGASRREAAEAFGDWLGMSKTVEVLVTDTDSGSATYLDVQL